MLVLCVAVACWQNFYFQQKNHVVTLIAFAFDLFHRQIFPHRIAMSHEGTTYKIPQLQKLIYPMRASARN